MSTGNSSMRQLWAGIKWMTALVAGFILLALLLRFVPFLRATEDITASSSPDGSCKLIVRQIWITKYRIDRNFTVVLIDTKSNTERELFRSFDQDPTIKQERFVWSADSQIVGLLGDDYFVVPNSELPSGEIVFLLYNLDSGDLWCNADNDTRYKRITALAAATMLGL